MAKGTFEVTYNRGGSDVPFRTTKFDLSKYNVEVRNGVRVYYGTKLVLQIEKEDIVDTRQY